MTVRISCDTLREKFIIRQALVFALEGMKRVPEAWRQESDISELDQTLKDNEENLMPSAPVIHNVHKYLDLLAEIKPRDLTEGP
jgi:hypothetical protein